MGTIKAALCILLIGFLFWLDSVAEWIEFAFYLLLAGCVIYTVLSFGLWLWGA